MGGPVKRLSYVIGDIVPSLPRRTGELQYAITRIKAYAVNVLLHLGKPQKDMAGGVVVRVKLNAPDITRSPNPSRHTVTFLLPSTVAWYDHLTGGQEYVNPLFQKKLNERYRAATVVKEGAAIDMLRRVPSIIYYPLPPTGQLRRVFNKSAALASAPVGEPFAA